MDETQTLRELLEIMHANDLEVLKIKVGDKVFELVRREPATEGTRPLAPVAADASVQQSERVAGPNVRKITAPLVGVFYRAASPDADPFVKEGDRIEAGQTVCVLEAMKLFNEIASDYAGVVMRIIPENGELVSLGQELFWIEP